MFIRKENTFYKWKNVMSQYIRYPRLYKTMVVLYITLIATSSVQKTAIITGMLSFLDMVGNWTVHLPYHVTTASILCNDEIY